MQQTGGRLLTTTYTLPEVSSLTASLLSNGVQIRTADYTQGLPPINVRTLWPGETTDSPMFDLTQDRFVITAGAKEYVGF